MSIITVNKEKCIKCGLCVKECPERILKIDKSHPIAIDEELCISCGHCVAICPREAFDNIKTPLINQTSSKKFNRLTSEEAENFLRSRRSIRAYMELYAPTLGLGSCWAGILEKVAFKPDSKISELLNIPKDKKITGAVMVGYPKYNYPRLVDRNPLDVTFYEAK